METATGDLVEHVTVGLGWRPHVEDAVEYDLDIWAFMFGGPRAPLADSSVVYYRQRQSADGSIILSPDDRVGAVTDDSETLVIDFAKVDAMVQEIVVAVSIHDAHGRGQNFYQVQEAYAEVTETHRRAPVARFDLNGDFGTDSIVELVRFSRQGSLWECEMVGCGSRLGVSALLDQYGLHIALEKPTHGRTKSAKPAAPRMHPRYASPSKVATASKPPTTPPSSPATASPSAPAARPSGPSYSASQIQQESRWKQVGTRCIGLLVLTAALWLLHFYLSTPPTTSVTSMPKAVPTNVPASARATVSMVTLGSSLLDNGHDVEPKTTFAPADKIYALIETSLAATNKSVRLDLRYGNRRRAFKVKHAILRTGQRQLLASFSNEEPWSPGNYSLDISLDGVVVRTAHFTVRKKEGRGVVGANTAEETRLKSAVTQRVDASAASTTSYSTPMPASVALTAENPAVQEHTLPLHPAISPSFDCKLARTPTEIAICSNDDLGRLDASMGRLYREVIGQATPLQVMSIRRAQRQWLMDELSRCGGNYACIETQHQARIQDLRQVLAQEKADAQLQAEAEKRSIQMEQRQLAAADRCFDASNYDCSIQIAKALLGANPNDRTAADLLQRSRDAQSKALHGNWDIH